MMSHELTRGEEGSPAFHTQIVPATALSAAQRAAILELCRAAYEEDIGLIWDLFPDAMHVLGYLEATLVSHALWVTRWLQVGTGPLLRTAYVELVATAPAHQGRGFATAVMRRLQAAVLDYDLAALCPAVPAWYARLGWETWRGPLAIRTDAGLLPTPDELVMVLRLPNTPPLDLDAPLSAEWRPGEVW